MLMLVGVGSISLASHPASGTVQDISKVGGRVSSPALGAPESGVRLATTTMTALGTCALNMNDFLYGEPISSEVLWTPVAEVNSPWDGSASATVAETFSSTWSYSFLLAGRGSSSTSTGMEFGATNGASVGVFMLDTWTNYQVIGYQNCPYAPEYTSMVTAFDSDVISATLQGDGICTCEIANQLSFTAGAGQYAGLTFPTLSGLSNFNFVKSEVGYQPGGTSITLESQFSSYTETGVDLSFSIGGGSEVTVGLNFDYSASTSESAVYAFSYTLPASSGTYDVYDLSAVGHPGYAFSYVAPTSGGGGCVPYEPSPNAAMVKPLRCIA